MKELRAEIEKIVGGFFWSVDDGIRERAVDRIMAMIAEARAGEAG